MKSIKLRAEWDEHDVLTTPFLNEVVSQFASFCSVASGSCWYVFVKDMLECVSDMLCIGDGAEAYTLVYIDYE